MTDLSPLRQTPRPDRLCRAEGLKIATAESCTGGLIAGAITESAAQRCVRPGRS